MALPTSVIRRGARRLGMNVEEAKRLAAKMDDSTAAAVFANTLADQPSRAASTLGSSLKKSALFVGGGAGLGAGAYGVSEATDYWAAADRAETRQEQVALARDIASSDELSSDDKEALIDRMFNEGILDDPGGGGDSILPFDMPDLFSLKGIILLFAAIYGGRALVARAGATGGGN